MGPWCPAGVVHAINRGMLFLKDPSLSDRGGFIVVRNKQVRARGNSAAAAAAANGGVGTAGASQGSVLASPQHTPGAGPQNPFGAGADGMGMFSGRVNGGSFGGGRGGGRGGRGHAGSGLVGQEVTVSGSAWNVASWHRLGAVSWFVQFFNVFFSNEDVPTEWVGAVTECLSIAAPSQCLKGCHVPVCIVATDSHRTAHHMKHWRFTCVAGAEWPLCPLQGQGEAGDQHPPAAGA